MLTKKRYSLKDIALWTRLETVWFFLYAFGITLSYSIYGFEYFSLPWTPIALIGTAVAFVVGFQNNSAYGRIWEARKIWGGIVNYSRTFTMMTRDMISNRHAKEGMTEDELKKHVQQIVMRHIAWLTALRHSMRSSRSWEEFEDHKTNREWSTRAFIPERVTSLEDDLVLYLSEEEHKHVMAKGNKATAILFLQSRHLKKLMEAGHVWEFAFLELENIIKEFFNLQGKSERIKNFPYPRQYATLNFYFVKVFLLLFPLALIPEFSKIGLKVAEYSEPIGNNFVWIAVPFCVIVSWIFNTMERIGRVGENPFEGTANDVPISTISRGIEIDIRDQIGNSLEDIPNQFPENLHIQM